MKDSTEQQVPKRVAVRNTVYIILGVVLITLLVIFIQRGRISGSYIAVIIVFIVIAVIGAVIGYKHSASTRPGSRTVWYVLLIIAILGIIIDGALIFIGSRDVYTYLRLATSIIILIFSIYKIRIK